MGDDELEELYRASLYALCYMFAYEYNERIDALHKSGRWDAWFDGTQERYGPTLNRVLGIIKSHPHIHKRVEKVYREDFPFAVSSTLGTLAKPAVEALAHEAGLWGEVPSWNLAYVDDAILDHIYAATGLGSSGASGGERTPMWDEWGLETDDWNR